MEFFDKLGKTASETYKYTAEKTSKLTKIAKLKLSINENKGKISDLYEEIGKKIYEKHIREENFNIEDSIEEICSQIDTISKEIEDARMEILKLNEKRQCQKCFAEIEIHYSFCPICGEKQVESELAREVEIVENLENSEIEPDNQKEAEIIKKEKEEQ